jgi:hypothetical protein
VISPTEAILRREIARLLRERTTLREELGALTQAAGRREEQARVTEATAVEPNDDNHILQTELRRQAAEIEHYRNAIRALHASRSWTITKPLRALSTMLGRPAAQPFVTDAPPSLRPPPPAPRLLKAEPAAAQSLRPAKTSRGHLFVAADMPPLFDQQAGALRLITLISLLHEAGWSLSFGSLFGQAELPGVLATPEGKAQYEASLRQVGVGAILYGIAEIDAYFRGPATQLDWAFLSFPAVARALMPLVRCRFPRALVIYDMVDSHGLRMAREAALTGDVAQIDAARRAQAEEVGLALAADVTLAISAEERNHLLAEAPLAVVKLLPLVLEIPADTQPRLDARRGLFFIGSFWHKPNGDGMIWFVDAIWPLIRAELPEVTLTIAGSNMGEEILALGAGPGIDVVGFVPEVQPWLDAHRVFVAPLRFGAGMKGKVAQSMIHGLPVVATSIGAEGMALENGTHLLVADDPAAFAQEVIALLRDDDLWQRLSVQGRRHIEQTLSRDAVRHQLEAVFGG